MSRYRKFIGGGGYSKSLTQKNEHIMAVLLLAIGLVGLCVASVWPCVTGEAEYTEAYDLIIDAFIANALVVILLCVGVAMVYAKSQALTGAGLIITGLAIAQMILYAPVVA